MPHAPHAYSLIYFYLLRNGYDENFKLETKKISEKFQILESDIISAFKFWHERQIIDFSDKNGQINIKLLEIKPLENNLIAIDEVKKENNIINQSSFSNNPVIELTLLENSSKVGIKPDYDAEEIEYSLQKSKDIRELLKSVETKFGRLLRPTEIYTIYGFTDWLRMPTDLAYFLISYCYEKGKKSLSYMETVAITWFENNIHTLEEAEIFVQYNNFYTKVLKQFGIAGRVAADFERNYIDIWLKEYQMPEQLILIACKRAFEATSRGNYIFSYANKIIKSWYEANVKTLQDLEKYDEAYQKSKKKKPAAYQKKSKLNNFDSTEIDYDELERLERNYIFENDMKGLL